MGDRKSGDRAFVLGAMLRMGNTEALEEVLLTYRACDGDEQQAAKHLGVSRKTLVNWRKRHPLLDQGVVAIRSEVAAARRAARQLAETGP